MAKHIKDICFFQDYGLWAKVGMQARITKSTPSGFIAECVEKETGKVINYTEELYGVCQEEAKNNGLTISQYMEICCAKIIEPNRIYEVVSTCSTEPTETPKEKKLKPWELPKG